MRAVLATIILGAVTLLAIVDARAQPSGGPPAPPRVSAVEDERERAFVEALRREDPGTADRYVALRDARVQASTDLQRVQGQYNAAGVELRPVFVGQLRQARAKYAQSSLALLEFLDARDRRLVAGYQDAITRINAVLEEHARMRAELAKLLETE